MRGSSVRGATLLEILVAVAVLALAVVLGLALVPPGPTRRRAETAAALEDALRRLGPQDTVCRQGGGGRGGGPLPPVPPEDGGGGDGGGGGAAQALVFNYRAGETLVVDLPAGWTVEWPVPDPCLRTDGYVLWGSGGGGGGLAPARLCVRPPDPGGRPGKGPGICMSPWGAVVYREAAGPPTARTN